MAKSLPDARAESTRTLGSIEVACGVMGVNIGTAAPVGYLTFAEMNAQFFFADIKPQGKTFVDFSAQDRIIIERYWSEA